MAKMILTQFCPFHSPDTLSSHLFPIPRKRHTCNLARSPITYPQFSCLLKVGFDQIPEIVHNKVLVAAGVSAAIGQLSKPFTSVLYGKDFDFRAAFQAGGFPSTHSSSVVAAATAIALERGLSDSIFGLTVVYAGLIMYDAQGVRREVGTHAKVLNKLISESRDNSGNDETIDGEAMEELRRQSSLSTNSCPAESSDNVDYNIQTLISSAITPSSSSKNPFNQYRNNFVPLKESIGHTPVEVVAGGFLGFFVSLVTYTLL